MTIAEHIELEALDRSAARIRALEQRAFELARSVEAVRRETLLQSTERIEVLEQRARDLAQFVETTRRNTLADADKKNEALEQKARDLARFVEGLRDQARLQSETEIEALGRQARDLAFFVETVRKETRLQSEAEIGTLHQQARELAAAVETVRIETQLQSDTEIAALGQQARDLAVSVECVREETQLQSDAETRVVERRLNAQRATTKALAESPDLEAAVPKILAAICRSLDCTSAAYWTVDAEAQMLRIACVWDDEVSESPECVEAFRRDRNHGGGLPERVWADGEPAWSSNLSPDLSSGDAPRSPHVRGFRAPLGGIAFPIQCGGDVLGVMQFFSRSVDRLDEAVRSLMIALGSQIGQFVEKKRAEKELRLFRMLIDQTTDGIEVIDPETGRFLDVNEKACAVHGYTRKEYLALKVSDVDPLIAPLPWKEFIETHRSAVSRTIESRHRRKDGSTFPIEVSLNFIRLDRDYLVAVVRDITERKQLEEQFRQSQKMEAFGQLAGGMAHDFNNLLMIISGSSELVLDAFRPGDENLDLIRAIQHASERAALLTRQLLAFSRKQVVQLQVVDLNGIVARTKTMLGRLIGEDMNLTTAMPSQLGRVKVDVGQVEQVIMNLVVNARDAMPRGGKISLETKNVDLDESYARNRAEVRPGKYVVLAVADGGIGMTEEVKRHIFEPFFTTKEVGKGTGLGLATVFGIVKQCGGHIDVVSEVGLGTTILVYFPAVEDPLAEVRPAPEPAPDHRGTETILLVEDDQGVRKMTRTMLEAKGYRLLEAADGQEAIELCRIISEPIHLLITDVVMPQMGGRRLAEELTKSYPELKVLFISGYTDDMVLREGLLQSSIPFLQKPFSSEALNGKVRAVLDGSVSR